MEANRVGNSMYQGRDETVSVELGKLGIQAIKARCNQSRSFLSFGVRIVSRTTQTTASRGDVFSEKQH